jgi:divalent metal cation (Fe/Co/Zn/Cd) transporter
MSTALSPPTDADRPELLRRGRVLEYLTVGYNSLEGLIAVGSGLLAGSITLVGFGFDSAIEVISGLALLWRLRPGVDAERREAAERTALRIVGVSFLVLAAYVLFDAGKSLFRHEAPKESVPGIALAVASLVVMPLLVRAKRRVARELRSSALAADAKQTELCTWLSAILLGGLVATAVAGWWWADPVAALVMVPIIAREGIEALRGKTCCDNHQCEAET